MENVEPPEVKLTAPALSERESTWLVVAKNRRVNRDWEALMQRYPENSLRCYEDLCSTPTTRQPGRVFPLKGKTYKGVWEYEVTKGDRVFYIPDEQQLFRMSTSWRNYRYSLSWTWVSANRSNPDAADS
ncbi:hypothetical protein [Nostoc spongiaeforme]|uniref:hypothetical protein n=1 Tax=Nostoc spongiaeforme TaxID=502487 RepID=UPI0028BDA1FA|nr:hypothetical protein [Nostoc spongiaeforme]